MLFAAASASHETYVQLHISHHRWPSLIATTHFAAMIQNTALLLKITANRLYAAARGEIMSVDIEAKPR